MIGACNSEANLCCNRSSAGCHVAHFTSTWVYVCCRVPQSGRHLQCSKASQRSASDAVLIPRAGLCRKLADEIDANAVGDIALPADALMRVAVSDAPSPSQPQPQQGVSGLEGTGLEALAGVAGGPGSFAPSGGHASSGALHSPTESSSTLAGTGLETLMSPATGMRLLMGQACSPAEPQLHCRALEDGIHMLQHLVARPRAVCVPGVDGANDSKH